MGKAHIAFIVESAHGHINSTLGIAAELIRRGYRVSYCVKEYFAPRIVAIGAEAFTYRPLENKLKAFREMQKLRDRRFPFDLEDKECSESLRHLFREEEEDTFLQLTRTYGNDRPALIIYDKTNWAGRQIAVEWNIPKIEHWPMVVIAEDDEHPFDENLVLVSLPAFFQPAADGMDRRFKFITPTFVERKFQVPWQQEHGVEKTILVTATTGLLPQVDFFKLAIRAFMDLKWRVILSIGDDIDPSLLGPLPENFRINQYSSHLDILKNTTLLIGQGGQTGIFEALYHGVPMILIPPSIVHDWAAMRVEELGLGIRLPHAEATPEALKRFAISILDDDALLERVRRTQRVMRDANGAATAADLIAAHITATTIN